MEPFGVFVFALVLFLFLGGFGLALAVGLIRGGRGSGSDGEETLEAKAERLHRAVHPDDDPGSRGDG